MSKNFAMREGPAVRWSRKRRMAAFKLDGRSSHSPRARFVRRYMVFFFFFFFFLFFFFFSLLFFFFFL